MATVTLTLTAAAATRVQAAFAKAFEADRLEAETDAALVKRKVAEYAVLVTQSVEANDATEAARTAAVAKAEAELTIT